MKEFFKLINILTTPLFQRSTNEVKIEKGIM